MSAYGQAYTVVLPSRALNPHWTVPALLYALAESLLQVAYCVLAFSWYSAISSKNKIVPDAIKNLRKPVMIASIVSFFQGKIFSEGFLRNMFQMVSSKLIRLIGHWNCTSDWVSYSNPIVGISYHVNFWSSYYDFLAGT
jgi:hypothetical protein